MNVVFAKTRSILGLLAAARMLVTKESKKLWSRSADGRTTSKCDLKQLAVYCRVHSLTFDYLPPPGPNRRPVSFIKSFLKCSDEETVCVGACSDRIRVRKLGK